MRFSATGASVHAEELHRLRPWHAGVRKAKRRAGGGDGIGASHHGEELSVAVGANELSVTLPGRVTRQRWQRVRDAAAPRASIEVEHALRVVNPFVMLDARSVSHADLPPH